VSQVADGKAKLTVALDGARAQRRPQNRWWMSSGGGGGSRFAWAERERGRESWAEGANGTGEVASRAWGSKGARGLEHGRRTRGRGRVHGGEIVGGRLRTADRWGRQDRERERAGAAENNGADRVGPWDRERERGGTQGCADRRDPPVRPRGRAGAGTRARTGLSGLPWAEFVFPFSKEFLIAFLFIFSRVFNSNSNQV
jgi:hypothetical protein